MSMKPMQAEVVADEAGTVWRSRCPKLLSRKHASDMQLRHTDSIAGAAMPLAATPTMLQAGSIDGDLVIAAVAGDADAFAVLYARYANRVFARLTYMIGPGPDREDVLQQVFLELHRALPRFRGDSALSTFLYRITANVAYDHLRRRMRRSAEHDPGAIDALIDGDQSPEDRARSREELRHIFGMLEQIKPQRRIAFVLVAITGLSLERVAELVGSNAKAVKQRVQKARHDLIALMGIAARRAGQKTMADVRGADARRGRGDEPAFRVDCGGPSTRIWRAAKQATSQHSDSRNPTK